jgi:hypothetical protein
LIIVAIEQLLDGDVDNRQRNIEANGVLASVNVHVHHVCALDLAVEICLLAIGRKLIVLLPCFDTLLQVRQIVLRPNSSTCLHWNDVVCLVDLDMTIARVGLPLVWNLHIFTHIAMAFSMCSEVQKCSQSPENTCNGTTRTSYHPAATWDTQLHAYVLFCAPTLPLFGALCASKIEHINLWSLDIPIVGFVP